MEENFARAHKSFLYVENITLSGYNFQDTLCTVEESNVTLFETRFYRNKIGYLAYINLNSNVLIMSSSVIENKIYQNAYYIGRSHMELNNTKFYSSKIKTLLVFAESQSHVFIDNLKLTNNHVTKAINICRKSKLKLYNADISRNKFSLTFLKLVSSSSALIQNNTITENLINAKIMKTSVMIFMIFQEDIFFTRIVKSS